MVNVVVQIAKYMMMVFFAFYAYECFSVMKYKKEESKQRIFGRQTFLLYGIHFLGYCISFLMTENLALLFFYGAQVILITLVLVVYQVLYPKMSRLITNNMCMLLCIGLLMITRLSIDKAWKQFLIITVSLVITSVIPVVIHKLKFIKKMTWLYAVLGIAALLAVCLSQVITNGAKITFTLAGVTFQPSEFVKILFVFCIAAMLCEKHDFKRVVITTIVAAAHVLILVASKDLGGALIYFVTYLSMLYVITQNPFYFCGGLLCGSGAAVVAYKLFAHVRVRVLAWSDPFSVIEKEGYQITQSLFAIGTGGWFGLGLYQGMPDKIPVAKEDFIFSAIAEEMGGIFALCLILVCASCFMMFINISMQIKDDFYRLIALGLGIMYGFQVFLTIGGAIKCIPSTGVTLPLVSYGGSSVLSTLIMFSVIQGLYILAGDVPAGSSKKRDEGEKVEKKQKGQK